MSARRGSGGAWRRGSRGACTLGLVAFLALFCGLTRWGARYPELARHSYLIWRVARERTAEQRRLDLYDETYPLLSYTRMYAPPDAVILFPPRAMLIEQFQPHLPLMASASAAYSFIHPRIPVHYGEATPCTRPLTHVMVWEHWGLEWVQPGAAHTAENRYGLFPLPPGKEIVW